MIFFFVIYNFLAKINITTIFLNPRFQLRLCKYQYQRNLNRRVYYVDNMVHGSLLTHPNAHTPLYDAREALAMEKGYHMRCICLLYEKNKEDTKFIGKTALKKLSKVTS